MTKKTLKFNVDEDHSGFEKVSVKPTKNFDLEDDINDIEGFSLLTSDQLRNMLENEILTDDQKYLINKILSARK